MSGEGVSWKDLRNQVATVAVERVRLRPHTIKFSRFSDSGWGSGEKNQRPGLGDPAAGG